MNKTNIQDLSFCLGTNKNRGVCPFHVAPFADGKPGHGCRRKDCDNLTGMPVMEEASPKGRFIYPHNPPAPEKPFSPE